MAINGQRRKFSQQHMSNKKVNKNKGKMKKIFLFERKWRRHRNK